MDEQRAKFFTDRVTHQNRRHPGYKAAWARFAEVVLAHGGDVVVPPIAPDLLIDVLRVHGQVWEDEVRVVGGEPSRCHQNAVELWRRGETTSIGTGYALSTDGLWREHSWGLGPDGMLVETTESRVRYFGVEFVEDNAEQFARWVEGGSPPSYRRSFGRSRAPGRIAARLVPTKPSPSRRPD